MCGRTGTSPAFLTMQLFSASNAALLLPFSGMAMAALYNTSSLNHTCQLSTQLILQL